MSIRVQQQQQKKSNGILGTLGTIATLGGTLTGQPWLSALGMGMQGANAMMNGDTSTDTATKTSGALNEVLSGLKDIWSTPTDDNPAKSEAKNAMDKLKKIANKASSGSGTPIADVSNTIGQAEVPINTGQSWDTNGGCWGTGGYRNPYFWENPSFGMSLGRGLGGV